MASLRRATSNIAAQVVSLAAGVFDRIVLVGLLLRVWGAETFADYAIVQSWAALLLMVELGAQIYFQNEEQRAFVRDDKPRFRRLASIHLGLSLAVVVPLALLFSALVATGGADKALQRAAISTSPRRAGCSGCSASAICFRCCARRRARSFPRPAISPM